MKVTAVRDEPRREVVSIFPEATASTTASGKRLVYIPLIVHGIDIESGRSNKTRSRERREGV